MPDLLPKHTLSLSSRSPTTVPGICVSRKFGGGTGRILRFSIFRTIDNLSIIAAWKRRQCKLVSDNLPRLCETLSQWTSGKPGGLHLRDQRQTDALIMIMNML